ncbi:hypothetical protein CLOM_g15294, partial [Closterium sp. NIES-68]
LVGIGADVRNVVDTRLSTVLGAAGVQESGVRVGTVEHLLSALEGCGVDNCVIRVDGGERCLCWTAQQRFGCGTSWQQG